MKPLTDAIREQISAVAPIEGEIDLTYATQSHFGHYQCNNAMKWAKQLGKPPREIAQQWAQRLNSEWFSRIEVAGPGFLNLTLSPQILSGLLNQMRQEPKLGVPLPEKQQRIIVDFSSPNIAKEMHVGHLRSTIIGDCLARLLEFLGHDVVRLNHVGDWGTAFGMLIVHMEDQRHAPTDLATLMVWYREAKARFDAEEAFKIRAREAVVALQQGDEKKRKLWQLICTISRRAFQEVYALLDVSLNERGESFYNPFLSEVIADLERKGLVTLSEGAKCLFHEGYEIPFMVQKSDGGYNYDTTDIAAMKHRVEVEKAERIIIVTDAGQSLHFELLRLSAQKAGYLKNVRFDHVPFGVVLGTDGKKFRTRSGEVERLVDLLHTAQKEAEAQLQAREHALTPEEVKAVAQILGIDAVKYADLSCHRISDYVFSYERMLRFEGNTAAFILYSYVRILSIQRRLSSSAEEPIVLELPAEIDLGLHLLRFSETLLLMSEELLPHLLTDYLYQLAQKFNAFFRDCRVEGSPEQKRRLALCSLTQHVMETSLHLLGLKKLERM